MININAFYIIIIVFKELVFLSFDFIGDRNKKIHFIGIGGVSMSGLAKILLQNGFKVSGSDMKNSSVVEELSADGAEIFIGHKSENIHGADLIVYTAAVHPDNPEYVEALKLNIPLMDRAEFLGDLMKGHKYNVAVSGTHGKTTTTSMLSHISIKAALDPTILVGGQLDIIGGNVRVANSEYFITEACEYKASFLKFYPYIGIILNIDADHLDFYRDINDIQATFLKFAKIIPPQGFLIANAEDERVMSVASNVHCNVLTYGIRSGQIHAKNISYNDKGCARFDICKDESLLCSTELNVPGEHNIMNALASAAASLCLNISPEDISYGLSQFGGTHRRFELKGVKNNITVIDDYAHHPTEIKATLKAAQNYPHKRIITVFQPHTYSRTFTLFEEFTNAFFGVDELLLADIYAAREKDKGIVSSDMLGDSIREKGINCTNFHNFNDIVKYLDNNLRAGDVLMTVGAGDIYEVGEKYLNSK